MLNTDGYVSECTGDNIFFVKDGKIVTPPTDAGILEGITRRFVMKELAPAEGITVEERFFTPHELTTADEIFLTGSAAEIIAVTRIGKTEDTSEVIGEGTEGPITKRLRKRFRDIVTSKNVPED